MDVFYSDIEYLYKNIEDKPSPKGGFVLVFVQAFDVREAISKITNELESLDLEIKLISYVAIYDNIPWENEKEQLKYDNLALQAKNCDHVICDTFYAYIDE
jgi:hypothetical protein